MEFKEEIIEILRKETGLKDIQLEVPPDSSLGDYAFACYALSKEKKKAPNQIAEELAKKIEPQGSVKSIKNVGPYVNFFIDRALFAEKTFKKICNEGEEYGAWREKGERVMVEFFHANTHKGVHIGHMRNICVGEALCRLLEKAGNHVIRVNFQGDIGPHVAKCLWGYLNLKEKEPETSKGVWLGKIYAKAHAKAQEDEKIEEEITEINNKLYAKDEKLTKIWEKTRQHCLDDFDAFYKEFGVKFDRLYFESETEERGKEIVQELLEKGIAVKSDGAIIMDLKEYDLGVFVLLTQDGNALYSTKDIGLVHIKNEEYGDLDHSLHLVGSEQEMHFRQLFKTLELMEHDFAKKSRHLSYGLVMLPEGKMSSRDGTLVLQEDLMQELMSRAKKEIHERHPELSADELLLRTKHIAYAALKFSMINRDFNKTITFDWDTALDFEGETGPYLVYTHARACSIIRKVDLEVSKLVDFSLLKTDIENEVIKMIASFPDVVKDAAEHHRPITLTRYCLDLCQAFNNFYHECRIKDEETNLKRARLLLVERTRQVLKNALGILGIEALEEM